MPIELILAGNGPGELTGWIRPVARAAKEMAARADVALRLTAALLPSQFATGREEEVVRGWNLFDEIIGPSTCLRLALGLGRATRRDHGVLVHLGGDLWLSARLARQFHLPACAFAETPLIAIRQRHFDRILAATDALAGDLTARGVPPGKLVVTGDPRVDAFPAIDDRRSTIDDRHASLPTSDLRPTTYVISFMPGSRDRHFEILMPLYLETAAVVHRQLPDTKFQVILSPFLQPGLTHSWRTRAAVQWPDLPVTWVAEQPWEALASSDLVVTIPGTNTMELALIGIPFAVVIPIDRMARASMEGALEWLGRVPWVGAPLKRMVLQRYLARHRFLALPNQRAGRAVVPEWIGRWTPQDLANRVAMLLRDADTRAGMASALRGLYPTVPGSSRRVAAEALALAGITLPT